MISYLKSYVDATFIACDKCLSVDHSELMFGIKSKNSCSLKFVTKNSTYLARKMSTLYKPMCRQASLKSLYQNIKNVHCETK